MGRVRNLGMALAVACAGVPAWLGVSGAGAAGSTASLERCASCTATSCSRNAAPGTPASPGIGVGNHVLPRATPDDTGVPGSDTAVIYSNFSQDKPYLAKWKTILEDEHYKVTEYLAGANGAGSATLANFVGAVKAGVLIISTHGADLTQSGFNGLLVSEFTSQAALDTAWNADEKDPAYRDGVLRKLNFVDNHRGAKVYTLWITQKGIQHFFGDSKERPADQLIFDGACWSANLAAAFGSTAYFGYTQPSTDPEVYSDLNRLLGRLDGQLNKATDRDTASAWSAGGFTNTATNQLAYAAQPATKSVVLSPDVSKVVYPDGQDYSLPGTAGPFKIDFDAAMDTSVSPDSFLSVKGATLSDSSWTSPTELTLNLKNSACPDLCPVSITIDGKVAVSAGDFHNWLDGNLQPAGGTAGVYPNGDSEEIPFSFASWHPVTAPDSEPRLLGSRVSGRRHAGRRLGGRRSRARPMCAGRYLDRALRREDLDDRAERLAERRERLSLRRRRGSTKGLLGCRLRPGHHGGQRVGRRAHRAVDRRGFRLGEDVLAGFRCGVVRSVCSRPEECLGRRLRPGVPARPERATRHARRQRQLDRGGPVRCRRRRDD